MPWTQSPWVRQGMEAVPRPASPWLISFSMQPHDFFSTPLLAHTKVHVNVQAGNGIWKSYSALSMGGFPYPSLRHSPLWDLSSCNPSGNTTTQTLLLLTHSLRAIKSKRNPSTKQGSHWQKETAKCLGEVTQVPPIFLCQGCHSDCGKEPKPQRRVPTCGPAPAILQPLPGSPPLFPSPLRPGTFGSSGREVMKSAGAGRIFSSRPAVGREKHIPFHVWFASVCWRAGLEQELAPSTARAWRLPSADEAKSRGKSACKLGTHSLLHSCEVQSSLRCKALTQACPGFRGRSVLKNRADPRHNLIPTCPWLHVSVTQTPQTCSALCPPAI